MSAPQNPPHLVVVRGEPSPEELAALTAVLAARAAAAHAVPTSEPRRTVSGWRDRSRGMQAPPRPGPGAWRMSTR
ncbi:acyl-CoA carboxylase subunit epsilon [Nocardiopsis alba]|uniref:Acyl-CoA carboxylase epsilon subunit n=1 Tax=Nocardiopsis alba (strain ATCC BAA-2165 / BE74) TaxID=1205910 RepID=J7L705_NOCAA|nr:acyl-CoA carboxylase subunit epsilon [Nocardiopsis alba]AFR07225.1 acyl-CoA carboxylase epsilon subunit [Nocardiopsis alba ATCC BAA-2165]